MTDEQQLLQRPRWVTVVCIVGISMSVFGLLTVPLTYLMLDSPFPSFMEETLSEQEKLEFERDQEEMRAFLSPTYVTLIVLSCLVTIVVAVYLWKMRLLSWSILIYIDTPLTLIVVANDVMRGPDTFAASSLSIIVQAALIFFIYRLKVQGRLR